MAYTETKTDEVPNTYDLAVFVLKEWNSTWTVLKLHENGNLKD